MDNNCWRHEENYWQKTWSHFFHENELLPERKLRKLNQELLKNIQFDGLTTTLKASCYVIPYKKYHIKLAIADVGDEILDSGILLKGSSFSTMDDPSRPVKKSLITDGSKVNIDSLLGVKSPQLSAKEIAEQKEKDDWGLLNVEFDFDMTVIPDTSINQLERLARFLLSHPEMSIEINGFTDNKGSKAYNDRLSHKRATVVTDYMISKGVAATRIRFTGLNFSRPIADNSTDRGRAHNRRVELILIEGEKVFKKSTI